MKSALALALALAVTAMGATTADTLFVTEYYDDCSTLPTKTVIDTVIHSYYPGSDGGIGQYTPHTGFLTTYTTVYDQICSTGFEPKTFTITEPCTETGQARAPTHLPQGFVETTVTCHVCAETPVVTPITSPVPIPPAPGAPAPTPAGGYPGGSPPGGPGGSVPPGGLPPPGGSGGSAPPGGVPPPPAGPTPPVNGGGAPPAGAPPTNGGSSPPGGAGSPPANGGGSPPGGSGAGGNPPAAGGAGSPPANGGGSPPGGSGAGGNPPAAGSPGSGPSTTNPARYGGGGGSGGNPGESTPIVPFTGLASHLSSSIGISFLVGVFSVMMGAVVFAL